jgi:hypothetical protein
LYELSESAETNLALSYKKLNDWDKAQYHIEKSFFYAKQLKEGESRVHHVFEALDNLARLHLVMGRSVEEKAIREKLMKLFLRYTTLNIL